MHHNRKLGEQGECFMCIFTCFVAQISPLHVCPVGHVSLFLLSCHTPHEYFSRHPAHTSSHTPEKQESNEHGEWLTDSFSPSMLAQRNIIWLMISSMYLLAKAEIFWVQKQCVCFCHFLLFSPENEGPHRRSLVSFNYNWHYLTKHPCIDLFVW